jgi:hypothetical protein
MKRLPLLFVLLMTQLFIFAQNNAISQFTHSPRDIDHSGCVKSITNHNFTFIKNKETKDTIKSVNKILFNKKGIMTKQLNCNNSVNDPWQIIEYDNQGRILTISRKDKNSISLFARQFFNNFSEHPDSLNIYNSEKRKTDQYINHFVKKLLVKQEYFTQDTLRHYNTYQYDKKNRMIKESFINTENGWGITLGKSITGDKEEKSLSPNDYTIYVYTKILDTLVFTKTKFTQFLELKDIRKKLKSYNYDIEITEEYKNNHLDKYTYTYSTKDSISTSKYFFTSKKEIGTFYNLITTPNKIVYISDNDKNSEHTTTILIEFDKFNNWIKKTYISKNSVTELIRREIEYYCH